LILTNNDVAIPSDSEVVELMSKNDKSRLQKGNTDSTTTTAGKSLRKTKKIRKNTIAGKG
jgi:hypothetical protein